jgi:hypothetical protein
MLNGKGIRAIENEIFWRNRQWRGSRSRIEQTSIA